MDNICELTFSVNYKSYLPLVKFWKNKISQKCAWWPMNFNGSNYKKKYLKEHLSKKLL